MIRSVSRTTLSSSVTWRTLRVPDHNPGVIIHSTGIAHDRGRTFAFKPNIFIHISSIAHSRGMASAYNPRVIIHSTGIAHDKGRTFAFHPIIFIHITSIAFVRGNHIWTIFNYMTGEWRLPSTLVSFFWLLHWLALGWAAVFLFNNLIWFYILYSNGIQLILWTFFLWVTLRDGFAVYSFILLYDLEYQGPTGPSP